MSKRSTTQSVGLQHCAVPWKPRAYQQLAIKWLLQTGSGGLFLDPGLGKTSIVLAVLKLLRKRGVGGRALVVAPLRVAGIVWPAERDKWTDFEATKLVVLHGQHRDEDLLSDADVFVINPEGLPWLLDIQIIENEFTGKRKIVVPKSRINLLTSLRIDTLVVDESTKFKNHSAMRSKILRSVLSMFKRRIILTGTPAPRSLMDLWSQMYIIDQGECLGTYITHYRKTFFHRAGYGGYAWQLNDGADKLIEARVKPRVLRLAASDYLQLPKLVLNRVYVELPTSARRVYTELEKELITVLTSGEVVTAASAGVASGKCAQVANGGLYTNQDNRSWKPLHNAKDEAVAELVESISGHPVLIAYEFTHDLQRLLKIFGASTPYIGGGVSLAASRKIEAAWNRGEVHVLLVHPASVAHGLNLQHASTADVGHIIWYSVTWNYEDFDQLIKRILRQGSAHKQVVAHLLLARRTVDEAKLLSITNKARTQNAFLAALNTYVRRIAK